MGLPLQAEDDRHVNGGAEGDVGDWISEVRVQDCVHHSVQFESSGKSIIGHQENAQY